MHNLICVQKHAAQCVRCTIVSRSITSSLLYYLNNNNKVTSFSSLKCHVSQFSFQAWISVLISAFMTSSDQLYVKRGNRSLCSPHLSESSQIQFVGNTKLMIKCFFLLKNALSCCINCQHVTVTSGTFKQIDGEAEVQTKSFNYLN